MTDLTSGLRHRRAPGPAKDFESWETVSIAESAQCCLVRCLAQQLNHESTRIGVVAAAVSAANRSLLLTQARYIL